MTFVIVACVARKAEAVAPAQELYLSDWFTKARRFAEQRGEDGWFILSAKYGLLSPTERIEPYDVTLNALPKAARLEWASQVASQLIERVPSGSRLITLAGRRYRDGLLPLLHERFTFEIPMKGLGIGRQLAYLLNATASEEKGWR